MQRAVCPMGQHGALFWLGDFLFAP
ncbi:hypothetical protein IL54_0358 [Sphingobium sp. ba1]|nr:hypothetical protein IL54_0358 [Sphingobium sp. ba1]